MRILCIYRDYHPGSTPYATILHAMLQRLAADGHQITAFAAQPARQDMRRLASAAVEVVDGVSVHRIRLLPERPAQRVRRGLNWAWFLLRALLFSRQRRKYDLLLGSADPPVLMGLTLRLIRRLTGLPYIYHSQELHPESAQLSGTIRSPFVLRLLQRIEQRTRQQAQRMVVLSEEMRDTACRSQVSMERLRIINNFSLHSPDDPEVQANPFMRSCVTTTGTRESGDGSLPPLQPFRVIFAGKLGPLQQLSRVIDAAHLLYDDDDIQFVFMGQEAQQAALQAQAGGLIGRTVHFIDHQPSNVAFACMLHADLGIVSLADGVYRTAFPSKLMTYLAAGLPVLAVVESQCALAELVSTHSLGFVTPDTTPPKIAATIRQARGVRRAGLGHHADLLRSARSGCSDGPPPWKNGRNLSLNWKLRCHSTASAPPLSREQASGTRK